MKWYEFTEGSYTKLRFRTEEEAKKALDWLNNHVESWQGDGRGITCVDTESVYFWGSFEEIKEIYSDYW